MDEEIKKKVDESWKETIGKEKKTDSAKEAAPPIEVTFNLFITGLMMEAMVALGDVENPITKKKEVTLSHAKFIIDTIAMLKDKTENNLTAEEKDLLESVLYDLRVKFVAKKEKA